MKYDYYMVWYLENGGEYHQVVRAASANQAAHIVEKRYTKAVVTSSIGLGYTSSTN